MKKFLITLNIICAAVVAVAFVYHLVTLAPTTIYKLQSIAGQIAEGTILTVVIFGFMCFPSLLLITED